MEEVLLSLVGVLIGGVIGLSGTYLQTKHQKHIRQREEILPVASKVLTAAGETFHAWGWHEVKGILGPKDLKRVQIQAIGVPESSEPLVYYMESYNKLFVAIDELNLLMRDIEKETEQLRQSVSIEQLESKDPDLQERDYTAAREALRERLRQFLGT